MSSSMHNGERRRGSRGAFRQLVALLGCAGLLVAACGSDDDDGAANTEVSAADTTAPASSAPEATDPGTTAPAADTTAPAADTTAPTAPAEPAPGVTDDEIYIGIDFYSRGSESGAVFGATDDVDARRVHQAAVDSINEQGGVLGRQIVPVYYRWNPDEGDTALNEEEQCALWTQDTPVFAVWLMTFQHSEVILTCLEEAGVLVFAQEVSFDEEVFEAHPHFVAKDVNLSRVADVWIDSLVETDFFGDAPKIGLLYFDVPDWKRTVEEVVKPALAEHGLEVTEEAAIPRPYFLSLAGDSGAAVQNAVLRFKDAGITHVLPFENSGAVQLQLTTAADRQDWHPRYGLSGMSEFGGRPEDVPEAQLESALGLGWRPIEDLDGTELPTGPAAEECVARWQAKGLDPNYELCDFLNVFVQAMEAAGEPDRDAFLTGLQSLDGKVESVGHQGFDFSRRDIIGAARPLAFDTACQCWQYTGPAFEF